MNGQSTGLRAVEVLVAVVTLTAALSGCGLSQVDAPLSFRSDRRLDLRAPTAESVVNLPLTVAWTASGFDSGVGGRRYAVFVDRVPLGPGKAFRRRVCSEKERRPVTLGEVRRPCRDDSDTILETTATTIDLRCLQPKRDGPERQRHRHTIAIVLMGGDGRRDGHAVSSISFRVEQSSAEANVCRRGTSA